MNYDFKTLFIERSIDSEGVTVQSCDYKTQVYSTVQFYIVKIYL